jgi:hypothetical protein
VNRVTPLVLLTVLVTVSGCWWISGPWTGADAIRDRYEKIEVGQLREDVEKEFGDPSEEILVTGPEGRVAEDSKEAWLLYKYDYPTDPLLITVKVDYFGIVTEKHLDDKETVSKIAEKKTREEKVSYPGAPQRRFQELLKKKKRRREF